VFLRAGEDGGQETESTTRTTQLISDAENKRINTWRWERKFSEIFWPQLRAVTNRKLVFSRRNLKETIFETTIPILMLLIGLSLTWLQLGEEAPPRPLVPE